MRHEMVRLLSVAFRDRRGVSAIEYAALATLLVMAIAASASLVGRSAYNVLSSVISAAMQTGGGTQPSGTTSPGSGGENG